MKVRKTMLNTVLNTEAWVEINEAAKLTNLNKSKIYCASKSRKVSTLTLKGRYGIFFLKEDLLKMSAPSDQTCSKTEVVINKEFEIISMFKEILKIENNHRFTLGLYQIYKKTGKLSEKQFHTLRNVYEERRGAKL